jgi:hypothetical protein
MDLLEEVTEAREFCESVLRDIDSYKLYPEETFSHMHRAILSSSAVDLQGEAFTPDALESGAHLINEEILWIGVHHDPLIQPYGRVISAKVFYSPVSGIHFIAAVIGYFDPLMLPTFAEAGVDSYLSLDEPNETFLSLEDEPFHAQLAINPHEIDRAIILDVLESSPDFVAKQPLRSLRKTADPNPLTIISLVVSIGLLLYNPFSKKFLERYGERAADGSIAFFRWLSTKVFAALNELRQKRVLFELVSEYKGCRVQFVTNSNDTAILCDASNSISRAASSAIALIEGAEHLQLQRLIYEFDLKTRKWLPLHATSKKVGVISNRPYLIAIDQMHGLSVGGVTTEDAIRKSNGDSGDISARVEEEETVRCATNSHR